MLKQTLGGDWKLTTAGESLPATVPGTFYADLLAAGKMSDPYWRDNEMAALALMDFNSITYSRSFEVSSEQMACDAVLLRCQGLDTIATVAVNGKTLIVANNMHRTWEADAKSLLRVGVNEIAVTFGSPTRYIKEAYSNSRADGSTDAMIGFPLLRKAHCMFGWDWGPRLPDAGIWRDIELLGITTLRIGDVYVEQQHANDTVQLNIHSHVELYRAASADISVTVTAPDGKTYTANGTNCSITIANPQLWWPNGYGEQPLYTVLVSASANGQVCDSWQRRIGLRTMTVHIEKDNWGECFAQSVNGVDIFAMGADYIPEDNILAHVNPARTRRLLEDAATAHFNTVRIWGGGYYPDDFFYDICDELGLVVWQDFMFACAVYNLTDEFDANIRAEVTDNVRRLRHHASLGLWCGNNEMEQFVDENMWVSAPRQKADYIKMYEYIIPQILKKEDPQTFYWPASPSCGGSFDNPNDENRGDVHYWAVWHGGLPFTDYRNHYFRYVSEFGFQSFPCLRTVESFTEPADRNIFSYVMEKHQRNAAANGKILSYLSQMYLYPTRFDTILYASQLLQAQAMQYGVEHWRRNRGRCMGAIVWQLNDCWPVASWSSIDYFGRWKALHYYMKRFFAPILLSCQEQGVLSQRVSVNDEASPLELTATLNVANESMSDITGKVSWTLRHPDALVIEQGSFDVTAPALTSVWLPKLNFSQHSAYDVYLSYSLEVEGKTISDGAVLFCPSKHFGFADPKLQAHISGDGSSLCTQR